MQAYAQAHPSKVAAIVLRGICLMRRCEIDWVYRGVAHFTLHYHMEQCCYRFVFAKSNLNRFAASNRLKRVVSFNK
jgi:hypothetical protein